MRISIIQKSRVEILSLSQKFRNQIICSKATKSQCSFKCNDKRCLLRYRCKYRRAHWCVSRILESWLSRLWHLICIWEYIPSVLYKAFVQSIFYPKAKHLWQLHILDVPSALSLSFRQFTCLIDRCSFRVVHLLLVTKYSIRQFYLAIYIA